eukprot:TRINITY_DN39134_c0_g1_i1.p1 TRINITY_DN39134_c0_g1~~TRINITY_DN39134_c0_g1_i1.p1  ORF type:complete len:462 (-),score=88.89 TRINITY_DN39134_c0_g1_i1:48-1433(-)
MLALLKCQPVGVGTLKASRCFSVKPQLDLKQMCLQIPEIQANLTARNMTADLQLVSTLYKQHCALTQQTNEIRHQRKQVAAQMKSPQTLDRATLVARGKHLKEELALLERTGRGVWEQLSREAIKIPNSTSSDAPVEEQVVALGGEQREFEFPALPHDKLAERLGLLDFEAGSKVAGPKFVFYKRAAALLELGLQQWAITRAVQDGFTPVTTPDLAHSWVVEGCGFNPRGEHTQVYKLQDSDLCLVGTAEIALAGMLAGTNLSEAQLPLKLVGSSHCFRTEAGAAGAAEKGLYRLHQFSKVELFMVTTPEDSARCLEELVALERRMLTELGLHFRVLDMPPNELGASAHRKFDIEAWMPGRGVYGEVTSASNCTDYQARRLGIKIDHSDGRNEFAHTLNGTAAAIPRLLIAILETHQNEDGSVNVPAVLQAYVGTDRIQPCLLYTSPSPRDRTRSRMPSSA